jgi:hypothetical protein
MYRWKDLGEELGIELYSGDFFFAESIAARGVDPRNPRRVTALPRVCKSASSKNTKQ